MIDLTFSRSIHHWIQNVTTPKKIRLLMAFIVGLFAIINGLSVFFPVHYGRVALLFSLLNAFAPFVPSGRIFLYTGRTMSLLLGFFLFLVAVGMSRGKERAWQCALILLPLSATAHIMKGLNLESTLLISVFWLLLLKCRPCFRVESDPWRIQQGFIFLGIGVFLVLTYMVSGYYILQSQFFSTGVARVVFHALMRRVVNLPIHELIPETRVARWFLDSIPWLSSAVLFTGMLLILRPVSGRWWLQYQRERNEWVWVKAWELIRNFGFQTMAFFALDRRNLRYIALGGEGVINYRLIGDTAVVIGDPVAAPAARERLLRQFLNLCMLKDWRVAIYQARPEFLELYKNLRLSMIKIGEEALLNPQLFTLKGSAMANVRTSSRRAEREGISLEWYEGEPPEEVVHQLRELSCLWLEDKGGKHTEEMGFSMGRLSEICEAGRRSEQAVTMATLDPEIILPRLTLVVARNQAGNPCAFMSFTPIYGQVQNDESGKCVRTGWGWALDLMRRVPDAPPGVMELLIVQAIERFRIGGADVFSLGLVALADTRQEMSTGQQHLAHLAIENVQFLGTHRSLMHFKQKFHPVWESRYVVASNTLALPKIGLALLRAHQA